MVTGHSILKNGFSSILIHIIIQIHKRPKIIGETGNEPFEFLPLYAIEVKLKSTFLGKTYHDTCIFFLYTSLDTKVLKMSFISSYNVYLCMYFCLL